MKQIFTLVRYDLRCLLRERGTALLLLAALAMALFGLVEGARFRQHAENAQAAAAAQEHAARTSATALAARYFADPASAAFDTLLWHRTPIDIRGYALREHVAFAAKPLLPGAALAIGQADLLPAYVRVRAESMESVRTAVEIEHPARLAAGRFDLLFFMIYLWPLVLLALTMSVLTQERESGRVRMLQLQGVNLTRMLLAQVAARCALCTAALVLAVAAAALAGGAVPASAAGVQALAAWGLVVALYSLFWAGVAASVCALCGSRMTAAFAGCVAWLVLAIVVPGMLGAAVKLGAPVPSRESYVQAMRDANDAVNADQLGSLRRFYDAHPEWQPQALAKVSSSVSRLQRAEELERAMLPVERRFELARAAQQRLFERYRVFSPVTLAYQSLVRLAGNDAARQQVFIGQVRQYQLALRAYFQNEIQRAALKDERTACARTCLDGYGFRDFDMVPRFGAMTK